MKKSDIYKHLIRLAIAGTGGEISETDMTALEMLFNELRSTKFYEELEETKKCAQNVE